MRERLLSKAQNCQNLKTCIKAPFKNLIANVEFYDSAFSALHALHFRCLSLAEGSCNLLHFELSSEKESK